MLLFGRTQHIDLSAIFIRIFSSRQAVLDNLVQSVIRTRVSFVAIRKSTASNCILLFYRGKLITLEIRERNARTRVKNVYRT